MSDKGRRVLTQMATGRLRTTVLDAGCGRYEWIRTPGRDCPEPFGIPRITGRLPSTSASTVELAYAEPAPAGGARYQVRGTTSLAQLLIERRDDPPPGLSAVLRGVGASLAALHRAGDPRKVAAHTPPGPSRLRAWLHDGRGPRAASRFHRLMTCAVGDQRLDLLAGWCRDAASAESEVVLHGAPGGGVVIMPRVRSGPVSLLVGDSVATGPATFDLGWFAGELLELRHTIGQAHPGYFDELHRALFDGYGEVDDLGALGRFAALSIWTHLHDFSAYMGWHDSLPDYIPLLLETLDAAASGELLDGLAGNLGSGRP